MKSAITFCLFFLAALALARPGGDFYTDKYDNVNLDEILSNKKLLEGYVNCVLEKGKCTPDGKELKDHIKEALATECGKCTDAQKKGAKRVIKHLIDNEKAYWNEITAKYDPNRVYTTKYEKELREVED